MRKFAVLVLVLVIGIAWYVLRERQPTHEVTALGPIETAIEPVRMVEVDSQSESKDDLAKRSPALQSDGRAPELLPPAQIAETPGCVIFGRAIDESGAGIAGATARLAAYPRWAEGIDVPVLPGKWELQGFEVRTDSQGRFRFDAPVPTAPVGFTLTPDDYHDQVRRRYGGSQNGDLPPLHAGENDLGVFKLATTGALSGYVRDSAGAPIAGARVRLGSERSLTEDRDGETDASGRYVIAHAAEGSHGVNAEATKYVSSFLKPFVVRRGETTPGPDFVLVEAPTIRGRVVDEDGRPLSNAWLWGWPSTSGAGAGARSETDGSFVVYLPQDEPYTLEVELDGFEPFGKHDYSKHYKPGTSEIVCVLKRDVMTTFVVLDAESGAPVTRFDIEISRNKGSAAVEKDLGWAEWIPQLREHPGGEMKLGARPGVDRFEIAADDHERQRGEIQHESPSSPRQVIRLKRGATLIGRVLRGTAPLAGAGVKIERGSMNSNGKDLEHERFYPNSGEVHFAKTDVDGAFHAAGLDKGEYRVTVTGTSGAPLVLVPIRLKKEKVQDLGDLNMLAGGTVHGRVLMEAGGSPVGLQIHLDGELGGLSTTADSNGQFQFEEVSVGAHELNAKAVLGSLAEGPSLRIEVGAGQLTEVVLDLSKRGVCALAVRVLVDGKPIKGVEVVWEPSSTTPSDDRVGETDADGWVHASLPVTDAARIGARTADGAPLGWDHQVIALASGARVERILELTTTTLEIEWPSNAARPGGEAVDVGLTEGSEGERQHYYWIRGSTVLDAGTPLSNRCVLPMCAPGDYRVDLTLRKAHLGAESAAQGYTGRAAVTAGVPARAVLTKSDRR